MSGQLSTSAEAWERVRLTLREAQAKVMQSLTIAGDYGRTDDELRHSIWGTVSKSGPATRRGELVKMGLVRIARDADGLPIKRPSDLDGPMMVWQIVPPAEFVEQAPAPTERQPNATGLAAARARAEWEIGDASWADLILRAYLNPAIDAAELEDERND